MIPTERLIAEINDHATEVELRVRALQAAAAIDRRFGVTDHYYGMDTDECTVPNCPDCVWAEAGPQGEHYAMYSPAGDLAVHLLIARAKDLIYQGTDPDEMRCWLDTTMDRVAGKHPEVWDTDVRTAIHHEIAPVWDENYGEMFTEF